MRREQPPSLAELTARLGGEVKGKLMTVANAEAEHFVTVEEYLAGLEDILRGDPDGKTLRFWIDSSALVLGKNLAKELLRTAEGKNVAEGIGEITATEEEIAENNELLRRTADAAGMTVDELLGDRENETAQTIARLREEKAAQVTELRTALQTYALELVHTLQEGNRRKLGMTTDELAAWERKFAAVEALPQDYNSYAERLRQEFIATKQEAADSADRRAKTPDGLKERSSAVREKIWGDYTQNIVDTLEKELPGDANEEKRRHLLAGLLRKGDSALVDVRCTEDWQALIIRDELMHSLPEAAVLDIARRVAIASSLASFTLERSADQKPKNKITYTNCIMTLVALDDKSTWARSAFNDGVFVSGTGETLKSRSEEVRERASQEIDLANEVDAVIKFLYEGLDESGQDAVTWGQNDHRILSPVWRTLRNNPPEFSPTISAPVTPDGIFYSQIDAPAASRVATQQATSVARAFMQSLSDTLNKDRLQHERRPVTPSDVEAKNNSRILAAEQQALASMNEGEEGRKTVERVRAEKTAVEQSLQRQIQDLEAKLGTSRKETATVKDELAQAREYARLEKEALVRENEALERKLEQAKLKTVEATKAMGSLLQQLRDEISKPTSFFGKSHLREAIQAILEKAQPKK